MRKYHGFRLIWLAVLASMLLPGRRAVQAEFALVEMARPEIDAFIAAKMGELDIPGLALAIVQGDEIAYVRGYGTADDSGRPVTPQTPFLAASFSKSFTALGVMQLVEAGKLRLDDPVQAYLPWFQTADPGAAAHITVRHLLHHTSGFSELEGDMLNLDRDASALALEAGVRRLAHARLNAAPGERFEYSNTNYAILGLLIQAVSGGSYEDYIQERIFAPLKMTDSHTTLEAARRGGLSSGYASLFGLTLNYDRFMPYARAMTPSSGLFASGADMARYLYAHLRQGRGPDGAAVISPAGMAELHATGASISEDVGYAMGWVTFPWPEAATSGGPVPLGISHGGDWANYKAIMVLVPERELGVAVLMNKNLPTHAAAYENIGWNTALLALGVEPSIVPPDMEFLPRYGRLLGAAIVLLLATNAARSAGSLLRPFPGDLTNRRRIIRLFTLLLLLDLALAGYLWFVHLPRSATTLPLALAFEPDIGFIYLAVLVFTLGWGAVRTALLAWRFVR